MGGNRLYFFKALAFFWLPHHFRAGNSIGVGISIAEWNHSSPKPWLIIFNIIGIALLFFRTFYKVLEKIMIFLIILMLVSFISTLILIKPSVSDILQGFIPSVPDGSLGLLIAFIASAFSIVAAFYQCYLVQERKRINPGITQANNSSYVCYCK